MLIGSSLANYVSPAHYCQGLDFRIVSTCEHCTPRRMLTSVKEHTAVMMMISYLDTITHGDTTDK